MILQSESYESWYCLPDSCFFHVCNPETSSRVTLATLGTVFQTDFVALLDVACWMLLFGCCFFGSLLVGNIGNQPNNKITKQQDNKKKRVSQPSYLMELSSLKSKTIHAERSISIMVPRAKPG